MKIENIRFIVEVSRWRSINQASSALYINQQQLSRLIRKCEEEIGVQIFERSVKGIVVTEEGEGVIKKFLKILELYDSLEQKEENQDIKGKLQIMAELNTWTSYSRMYRAFIEEYPLIDCYIRNLATETIIDATLNKEGIGLITRVIIDNEPDINIPDSLQYVPIAYDHAMVYGTAESSYIKKYKTLSLATLKELPLVNFKPYLGHPSILERIFRKEGKPNIRYEVSDIRVFNDLVTHSDSLFIAFRRPQYVHYDDVNASFYEVALRNDVVLETGIIKHRQADKLQELFYNHYLNYYKRLYAVEAK